ncbi:prepilin peptidase [Defluviimonas sp. WL0002]|uniref:Prepilin peptidase n=1 Tax=Albidovulum marisflavi TaxID=2984159 RepID=A0ABT2ZAE7_9RHOB|nr:prepilin peptidase [Defluviimonas sp. WL0002]MCV2868052.1 prepilin peptidase [Defluviimonas sp. WL0002]
MLDLNANQVHLVFFVLMLPIAIWVMLSDLRSMRIPNLAVLATVVVFAVAGFIVLPTEVWLWRWVNLVVVLAIGVVLHVVARVGEGDVKFAAAAAPFFAQGHVSIVIFLLAACLLAAFVAHRLVRRVSAIRSLAPDWASWTRKEFPMGVALAATLMAYLASLAFPSLTLALMSMRM